MSQPEQWVSLLFDQAVKATVILAAAWATALAARRGPAALRHFVWTTAVVSLLVLPLASVLAPEWPVAAPRIAGRAAVVAIRPGPAPQAAQPAAAPVSRTPLFLLLAWAAGSSLLLGRLAAGIVSVTRTARRARPVRDWDPLLDDVRPRLGLRRRPAVLLTPEIAVPITWGLLRARVLLPADAVEWAPERLRAVLAHELAHVKRHDCLTQFLAETVRALYWFHPLAWWAAAQARLERERACDDRVLALGAVPADYAAQLLEFARSLKLNARMSGAAVGMAQCSHLAGRLAAILDPGRSRRVTGRKAAVAATLIAAGLLVPLAALRMTAQSAAGSLRGTVLDASGGVVPNATVIASLNGADRKEIASTGPIGEFDFGSLPEGKYTVEVKCPGFALYRRDVAVTAGQAARLDATLDVGRVAELIEVVARSARAAAPPPPAGAPRRIRVGGNVQATKIISAPPITYPDRARQAGVQGTVLIEAVISVEGSLIGARVLNGLVDPELAAAALDAVKTWRYQPTLLNGQPVEVVTTITVRFRLEE